MARLRLKGGVPRATEPKSTRRTWRTRRHSIIRKALEVLIWRQVRRVRREYQSKVYQSGGTEVR